MSEEKTNPWIEGAAVIITSGLIGLLIGFCLLGIFYGLRWSLANFGIHMSMDQYVSGIVILVITRMVLSYLFVRNK